jgi:hypothetical protein
VFGLLDFLSLISNTQINTRPLVPIGANIGLHPLALRESDSSANQIYFCFRTAIALSAGATCEPNRLA